MRKNNQSVNIVVFGDGSDDLDMSDEDVELAEQGLDLFKEQGINLSRSEGICAVAEFRGEVVGAVTLGKSNEGGGFVYTFSCAVDDAWKRRGIARALVKIAVEVADENPMPHSFRVWVVNPYMVGLLEGMGFEEEHGGWSMDRPHMYKWS